jgi:hypothetical protein
MPHRLLRPYHDRGGWLRKMAEREKRNVTVWVTGFRRRGDLLASLEQPIRAKTVPEFVQLLNSPELTPAFLRSDSYPIDGDIARRYQKLVPAFERALTEGIDSGLARKLKPLLLAMKHDYYFSPFALLTVEDIDEALQDPGFTVWVKRSPNSARSVTLALTALREIVERFAGI